MSLQERIRLLEEERDQALRDASRAETWLKGYKEKMVPRMREELRNMCVQAAELTKVLRAIEAGETPDVTEALRKWGKDP